MKKKANTYKVCKCKGCKAGKGSKNSYIKSLKKKIRRDGIENVKLGGYTD